MAKNYHYYYYIQEVLIIHDRFICPLLLSASWLKTLKKKLTKKGFGDTPVTYQ